MYRRMVIGVLILLMLLPVSGSSHRIGNIDSLVSEWKRFTVSNQFDSVVSSGKVLYEKAVRDGDDEAKWSASLYVAQAYMSKSQYDSVYLWLLPVEREVEECDDQMLKVMMYNIKAILALSLEVDYGECFENLNKALEIAEETGAVGIQCGILCNMAGVSYSRDDTTGLRYARRAYELSTSISDNYTIPPSLVYMVRMFILREDYDSAMVYVDKLEDLYVRDSLVQFGYMAYLLKAEIMQGTGKIDSADLYYRKAMDMSGTSVYTSRINGYLHYGRFLQKTGRLGDAYSVLEEGLVLSRDKDVLEPMGELLLGLSEVCEAMGDDAKAYDYYQQYHVYEQQRTAGERKYNQLLLMFQTLQHQQEMTLRDQELMLVQRRNLLIGAVSLVLLTVLVFVWLLYRKRNRMYRQMVENHYKLSQTLVKALHDLEVNKARSDKRAADDLLFDRIERLMKEDRVYRRKDISLEVLSDMLDTNRTYISNTINQKSGKSFYNYINGYRIAEAMEVLSDVENDTPLKALYEDLGFNSMSVFYRTFQKETGVPPSRYREEMRRIRLSS